ncbi:hypothetical protein AB0907_36030 [Streptomyces sp. NPDC006975]|uniref:hypothetical protein n=1 Tax=Streptomyces sp. NPDC006975 TaxID=3154310 RepID=UPI0034537120
MEVTEVPPERPAPRRRRGRTALLVTGAAVLGLVAGACAGYLIQADREPTALPSLSQPALRQAAGPAPTPLSAAQDRKVKIDGDLRKLLLEKPAGAKEVPGLSTKPAWEDLADYAAAFNEPGNAFDTNAAQEFRRAAAVHWLVGSTYVVDIRLVQFRQEESVGALQSVDNDQYWAGKEEDTDSWPLPGTDGGMAYVHHRADDGVYSAEAHAWRGDIAVQIWVYDSKPVSKAKIMDLAERQLERL